MNPKNIKFYNCNGEYYVKDQYITDKLDLRRGEESITLSSLSI